MYHYNFLDVYVSKLISMAGARLTEKKFLTKYYGALCESLTGMKTCWHALYKRVSSLSVI